MAQQVEKINDALGLRLSENGVNAPAGSMKKAENAVIRKNRVAETRRGFEDYKSYFDNALSTQYTLNQNIIKDHITGLTNHRPVSVVENRGYVYSISSDFAGKFTVLCDYAPATGYPIIRDFPASGWDANKTKWFDVGGDPYSTHVELNAVQYRNRTNYAVPSTMVANHAFYMTTSEGVVKSNLWHAGEYVEHNPSKGLKQAGMGKGGHIIHSFNGPTNSISGGWIKVYNDQVSTLAYRYLYARNEYTYRQDDTFNDLAVGVEPLVVGPPSEAYTVVTPIAPDVTGVNVVSNVASIVFDSAHNFSVADVFEIVTASDSNLVGTAVVATVVDSTTITIATTGVPDSSPTISSYYYTDKIDVSMSDVNYTDDATVRLYRTKVTTVPVTQGATNPGDEMYLVVDQKFTPDVSTGEFNYTDETDDFDLGDLLHTNPSQDGIAKAHYQPPQCIEMAYFRDHAFYGNVLVRPSKVIQLTQITGITDDTDTFTVNGEVYTFSTATDFATNKFKRFTSGSPSENIRDTAIELCRVINQNSPTIRADYISGFDEAAGSIAIEYKDNADVTFTIKSSTTVFTPDLSGSGTVVETEIKPNRIYYSELQQPDHVPVLNYFEVGNAATEIVRMVAKDDRMVVITNNGFHLVTGYNSDNFDVTPMDSSIGAIAPRTTVLLDGYVYTLTQEGFKRVETSEIVTISQQIDPIISGVIPFSNLWDTAWCVADPVDHEITLFLPSNENDDLSLIGYRWNASTGMWTTLERNPTGGGFRKASGDLYLSYVNSALDTQKVVSRRHTGTSADYDDESIDVAITVNSASEVAFTVVDEFHVPKVGDRIVQNSESVIVTAVSNVGTIYTCTLEFDTSFTSDAATWYVSIPVDLTYTPLSGGDASIQKQFTSTNLVFEDNTFEKITIGYSTDQNRSQETIEVDNPLGLEGWGAGAWGDFGWGSDDEIAPVTVRTYVPDAKQFGQLITVSVQHNRSGEKIEMSEIAMFSTPQTEVTGI